MAIFHELLQWIKNPKLLIEWGGYPALIAVIFAETGLLVGFFLPGDSLLVTAGMLVNGDFVNPLRLDPFVNLLLMNAVLCVAAITGDAVGYWFGRKTGPALYDRKESMFFKRKHLLATQAFYEKHGGKTIVIARFMPFARTFAPIVAGVAQMPYRRFALFNVAGGIGWIVSMTFLGYFLGKVFDAKQMERIVYVVIVISLLPMVIGAIRQRMSTQASAAE